MALLGLAMADTDPRDFASLCSTGECPDNWRNVDGNCVLFMFGWEEERALPRLSLLWAAGRSEGRFRWWRSWPPSSPSSPPSPSGGGTRTGSEI